MQQSLLMMSFSYVFANIKSLIFEKFAYKLEKSRNLTVPSDCRDFFDWMNLKNEVILFLFKFTKKRAFQTRKQVVSMTKKGKNLAMWKNQVTMFIWGKSTWIETSCDNDQKRSLYKQPLGAPEAFLTFHSREKSLYNTTASMNNLTCTEYLDFGKCQERFGWFF